MDAWVTVRESPWAAARRQMAENRQPILLPIAFRLLLFATHMAFGLVHLAIVLAVVIFLVGLVRRMLVMR